MRTVRRQRLYAALLGLGASILLSRTIIMLRGGALDVLVGWVSALLVLELLIDTFTLLGSLRWCVTGAERHATPALRFGAAAAILHALRVLVFALGRVEPFLDLDVRPEQRLDHAQPWSWGEVYFASTLSVLGVLGVIAIWRLRGRARRRHPVPETRA